MTNLENPAAGPRRASTGPRRNPDAEAASLAAARGLLAEKGYAGFSVDEVARRAGAGKPTIYRRWPNKAELIVAVYNADKAAHMIPPATGDLAADIEAYTLQLWGFWRETPLGETFRALIAEAQTGAAAMAALREKFLDARVRELRSLFADAAERGEIAPAAVDTLLELYIGFNWLRLLTDRIGDTAGVREIARALARAGAADGA
jgi:AcrR family transcriptional regulator